MRSFAVGELEPGSYRLTLQMEDGGGGDAEASHDFMIVDR